MSNATYNLHLKGFVGGADLDRNYVDFMSLKTANECCVYAEFLPKDANLIVFGYFVIIGLALVLMRRLLEEHGKNLVFFTGINNKL